MPKPISGQSACAWPVPKNLKFYFTPTRLDRSAEIRKAVIKNLNLPILQLWFHGHERTPLHCLISKQPGFIDYPHQITGKKHTRFAIDFNHICQRTPDSACPGTSVDKADLPPSGLFRERRLDQRLDALIEMMTTMPVNPAFHSFITQDSSRHDISLVNFKKSTWPWGLKNQKNFDKFCGKFGLSLDYHKFVAALSKVHRSSIIDLWESGELTK